MRQQAINQFNAHLRIAREAMTAHPAATGACDYNEFNTVVSESTYARKLSACAIALAAMAGNIHTVDPESPYVRALCIGACAFSHQGAYKDPVLHWACMHVPPVFAIHFVDDTLLDGEERTEAARDVFRRAGDALLLDDQPPCDQTWYELARKLDTHGIVVHGSPDVTPDYRFLNVLTEAVLGAKAADVPHRAAAFGRAARIAAYMPKDDLYDDDSMELLIEIVRGATPDAALYMLRALQTNDVDEQQMILAMHMRNTLERMGDTEGAARVRASPGFLSDSMCVRYIVAKRDLRTAIKSGNTQLVDDCTKRKKKYRIILGLDETEE